MADPKKYRSYTWRQAGTVKFDARTPIQFIMACDHDICIWTGQMNFKVFLWLLPRSQVQVRYLGSHSVIGLFCSGKLTYQTSDQNKYSDFFYKGVIILPTEKSRLVRLAFLTGKSKYSRRLQLVFFLWNWKNLVNMCHKLLHSFMSWNTIADCVFQQLLLGLFQKNTWGKSSPQKYLKSPKGDLSITPSEDSSQKLENCPYKAYLNLVIQVLDLGNFQDLYLGHHTYCGNWLQEFFLSITMCP